MITETLGWPVQVTKTDFLKVKYAILPIVSTSLDIMVQVVEPIALTPMTRKISIMQVWADAGNDVKTVLASLILDGWKQTIRINGDVAPEIQWMDDISKVVLVECDLLAEKAGAKDEVIMLTPYKLLKARVPNYDGDGVTDILISDSTWQEIQDVRAGKPVHGTIHDYYQFNAHVLGGNADDYIRCVCSRNEAEGAGVQLVPA